MTVLSLPGHLRLALSAPGRLMHRSVPRELASLGSAAALYPLGMTSATNAALLRVMGSPAPTDHAVHTPVVLVHGYGGNRSNWVHLEQRLLCAGFLNLHAMRYTPLATDLPTLAERLLDDCRAAMAEAGSARVHVVGHSLGGVVLRYAAACLGLDAHLATGAAVASPFRGTPVASWGRGAVAASMRPGSSVLRALGSAPCAGSARWVAYWSDADLVVSPDSAQLAASPSVSNVHVPGEGHVSILRSAALLDDVVRRLLDAEDEPPTATAAGARRLAA